MLAGIVLKRHAPCKRTFKVARVELIQEVTMVIRINADGPGVTIVEGPTDVVVSTQVVDPGCRGRKGVAMAERLLEELRVSCGGAFPEQG